ncbi:hypothetical protein C477_13075 [Haloterrigena salina JCM 13891]|uniref:Uncharacterized protein n=1 Tax=Haloterrigena salina JCM 13891 TaxID=1227488 RepID=M0C3D2_9EURY|nr:hypothetical protein C477_13075 [Haloterrigena salina JCM 13891]
MVGIPASARPRHRGVGRLPSRDRAIAVHRVTRICGPWAPGAFRERVYGADAVLEALERADERSSLEDAVDAVRDGCQAVSRETANGPREAAQTERADDCSSGPSCSDSSNGRPTATGRIAIERAYATARRSDWTVSDGDATGSTG